MNLDRAIEIQENYLRGDEPDYGPDLPDSIRLGIEALKGIKAVRQLHPELSPFPLPGETKD